ncbi:LysE family translocator [Nocardia sp. NPDC051929]|uniref:LysE family translocator n=1 Tax=unclassified Nocardia TaxID=2637762 RepID=UPI003418A214
MGFGVLGAFWAVSLLFACTPGAEWAYTITAGLRYRSPAPAVAGMLGGHLLATIAAAVGIAATLAGSPPLMTALTALGAAYLIGLGIGTFRNPPTPHADIDIASASRSRQVMKGFGVSGLNPKVFVLFLALLPQFSDPTDAWPIAVQILALGTVHIVNCLVIYTGVGLCARFVLGTRPTATRMVGQVSGVTMVGLGVILLIEQLAH